MLAARIARFGGLVAYDVCGWNSRLAVYMEARRSCRELIETWQRHQHDRKSGAFAVLERGKLSVVSDALRSV
jgi:hypothetical protein